ncbi:snare Sed5 [Gamsiella multidivaricata]|uniref:snare Sed5 n=1 Tax=Gamsiella multidivaricata TaxID=101098 RepID=UPI00221E94C7|nr:snare Sed5 [Gamsiella multidivaricata]KAG0369400.1 cis-Golgi t-SNARE syntaxin [Gamsiella multidivaricata]KAI7829850.1 snare Sed5 [Gamsiella multidivaricata]
MDRSAEFFSTVESLRSRAQPHIASDKRRLLSPIEQQQAAGLTAGVNASARPKSEFTLMASLINKDIHAAAGKLQKLARLAKRKTLFDDRPVEISELIYIIKQDIAKLNKQIAHLQSYLKEQSAKSTSSGKQAVEHNANVVVMLQSRLAAQTSAFKDVLELRTENMKATKDRREQFMFTAQQQGSTFASDSPLYNLDRRPASSTNPPKDVLSLDLSTPSHNLQQQQVQLVDSSNQYLESRSTAIESIESTLQELGGIFQQLAQMVSEQRDMVQRIDANTDDIESNVTGAQTELLKYYSYVSSNRWLMVKVFAVLISSAVTLSVLS